MATKKSGNLNEVLSENKFQRRFGPGFRRPHGHRASEFPMGGMFADSIWKPFYRFHQGPKKSRVAVILPKKYPTEMKGHICIILREFCHFVYITM